VVRSESNESITVEIDGATGERYDIAVNLAGPELGSRRVGDLGRGGSGR